MLKWLLCSCLVQTLPLPTLILSLQQHQAAIQQPPRKGECRYKTEENGDKGRKMTQTQHNTTIECVHTHHTHIRSWLLFPPIGILSIL